MELLAYGNGRASIGSLLASADISNLPKIKIPETETIEQLARDCRESIEILNRHKD